jgi:short-subunit dehydrogenase
VNQKIKDFKNLNIWLIGASSGIGKALSIELLLLGANLNLSSRRIELLNEIKSITPNQVKIFPLDVLNLDELKNAFSQMEKVDLIIYLAADYSPQSINNLDSSISSRIIDVNLKGAVNLAAVTLPRMIKEKRGHLSFVASIAGYIGLPSSSVYGATKAGLINFCESIYNEAKEYNIDISLINPGFVQTELTDKNNFNMPFIMTPKEAALEIIKGYQSGNFAIVFPKFFSYFFRLLRIIPYYFHLKLLKILVKT